MQLHNLIVTTCGTYLIGLRFTLHACVRACRVFVREMMKTKWPSRSQLRASPSAVSTVRGCELTNSAGGADKLLVARTIGMRPHLGRGLYARVVPGRIPGKITRIRPESKNFPPPFPPC